MIRRLVEQQDVRLLREGRGDRQALSPAARERRCARFEIRKTRAAQRLRRLDTRSSCGTPACSIALSTTERTVRPRANSETCVTQARRVPLRTARSPLSGFTRPYRISRSVDFPEPFGPIRPMRSPSETVNEIFLKSGATPNFFERSCALIIGIEFAQSAFSPITSVHAKRSRMPRHGQMREARNVPKTTLPAPTLSI